MDIALDERTDKGFKLMAQGNSEPTFRPLTKKTFKFRCHKGIGCFTTCCADLNLVLTPYDILRLKHRLDLTSDEFLDKYTRTRFDPGARFPRMTLKMNEDEKRTCPFLTLEGCSVYEDRPGACRIYPVGRAAMKMEKEESAREKFFIVDEAHCLGFHEDKSWDVREWMANEGVDEYNAMNDQWLEIVTSQRHIGPSDDAIRKVQMFSMASYNLDKFRQFLFQSKFFGVFDVPSEEKDRINSDDVALMQFGFKWLKFSLFGEKTIRMK